MLRIISSLVLIVLFALASGACAADEAEEDADPGQLIIYSGRGESLVGPLLERFEELTGIEIKVRYGDTAAMAIAISEEGSRSPADIYYGQDAGALSFLSEEGLAAQLPADVTAMVDGKFRDDGGRWIATSGRARVLIVSPDRGAQPARLGLRSGRIPSGRAGSAGRRRTAVSRPLSPPCARSTARTELKSGCAG